jgi:predicted amidohydrolase
MEMEILVNRVGLTLLEAIAAATRNNATALGIEESYGTLEPGCEKLKCGILEPLPRDVYTDAGS